MGAKATGLISLHFFFLFFLYIEGDYLINTPLGAVSAVGRHRAKGGQGLRASVGREANLGGDGWEGHRKFIFKFIFWL